MISLSAYIPEMIETRRKLHKHPEIAWTEFLTTQVIVNRVRELGFKTVLGEALFNKDAVLGREPAVVEAAMARSLKLGMDKKLLDEMQIPFEINALSAHRTPEAVEAFAKGARDRGLKVIIAAAGMAAALPGVIAANTTLPVIGVPVKGSMLDGVDALYSIIQMPAGIPVATVAINGAMNAAILAVQMLALSDEELAARFAAYKEGLKQKIVKANEDLKAVKYAYKTN